MHSLLKICSSFRQLLLGGKTPVWLTLVVTIGIMFWGHRLAEQTQIGVVEIQGKQAELISFRSKSINFKTKFSEFAYLLIKQEEVDTLRLDLMSDLTGLAAQADDMSGYLSDNSKYITQSYVEQVVKTQSAIRKANDLIDMKTVYEEVGALIDAEVTLEDAFIEETTASKT